MNKIKGSCLCKSIAFEIKNECRYSVICHCTMCQKANAEFSSYVKVKKTNFRFKKKKNLKWFNSSKNYKRGFCSKCGSSLFFQSRKSYTETAISSGSLNADIPIKGHIYYNDKKFKISFNNSYKKFSQSSKGYFDKLIYKIR